MQTAGRMQIFFCSSPIFSEKIVDLRTGRLFYIFAHQCFVGAIWTHSFQKGGIAFERLNTTGLDYMEKIFFCVIESK